MCAVGIIIQLAKNNFLLFPIKCEIETPLKKSYVGKKEVRAVKYRKTELREKKRIISYH